MVPPLRRIWFWTFWQIEKDCVRGERGEQTKHWWVHWQRGAIPTWAAEAKFPCLTLHRLAISNGLLEKTKAAHIFSLMLKSETNTMKYIFVSWAYLWQVAIKRSSVHSVTPLQCKLRCPLCPRKKTKKKLQKLLSLWLIHYSTFASFWLTRAFLSHEFVSYLMC